MKSLPKYAIVYGRKQQVIISYFGPEPIRTIEQAEETQFWLEFTTGKPWKILKIEDFPVELLRMRIVATEHWRDLKRKHDLKKRMLLVAKNM
jgi:hypothetical protein